MIDQFNLKESVKIHGFVPYVESVSIQRKFDLLLATSEKVIGGEHYSLPSKIFDSIGLNIPILGFVTEGIQMEFIKRSGLGLICSPDRLDESVSILSELLKFGKQFRLDKDYIESFHRRRITERLVAIITPLATQT